MDTAENLGFVVARSNTNGLNFDLRHTPSFISSSRFAAYREILCPAASRYAPDLRPGLLEVKGGVRRRSKITAVGIRRPNNS